MSDPIEAAIVERLARLPAGKSAAPEDVARAVDPEGWRRLLGRVKAVASGLARDGRLVILRHNKPADPDDFKGVWRMRLPDTGTPQAEPAPGPVQGDAQ